MASGSATDTGRATSSWHRLAQPTAKRRALWARGTERTIWRECGKTWDAVVIAPITLGLDVLAAMRLDPRGGYPVLADFVRPQLYVLVRAGTGNTAAGLPGVRVLTGGSQLLVPATAHGTPSAHWLSPPREGPASRLVPADQLTTHLRAATGADQPKAAAQ